MPKQYSLSHTRYAKKGNMDMNVKIKPYKVDDKEEVLRLLTEAELPIEDLTIDKLRHFLVVRQDHGSVVGAIGIEAYREVGLLRSLVVHSYHRGKGFGRLLTDELEISARKSGIKALYLLTMTAADYFPRLGYQVTQRAAVPEPIAGTEEFKNVCPVSSVCFYKDLGFS